MRQRGGGKERGEEGGRNIRGWGFEVWGVGGRRSVRRDEGEACKEVRVGGREERKEGHRRLHQT